MSQATPRQPNTPKLPQNSAFPRPRFGWLLYLVVTSLVIGGVLVPLAYVPLRLVSYPIPRARRLAYAVMVRGVTLLMRAQVWMRLQIDLAALAPFFGENSGKPRAPGPLLVSNHRSHLDTFLLLARVPGVRLLAKRSLFFVPLLGIVMVISRQIAVRRGDLRSFLSALDRITAGLRAGDRIHVFPEMTRCEEGARTVAEFTLAPFARAIAVGAPVAPLVFAGTDRAWPKGRYGIRGGMTVRLIALPVIAPGTYATSEELARAAHAAIADHLERMLDDSGAVA